MAEQGRSVSKDYGVDVAKPGTDKSAAVIVTTTEQHIDAIKDHVDSIEKIALQLPNSEHLAKFLGYVSMASGELYFVLQEELQKQADNAALEKMREEMRQ